jgi:O-antigen ligase
MLRGVDGCEVGSLSDLGVSVQIVFMRTFSFSRNTSPSLEAWRRGLLNGMMFSVFGILFLQTRDTRISILLMFLAVVTVMARSDTRWAYGRLFLRDQRPDLRWIAWPFFAWLLVMIMAWWCAPAHDSDDFPNRALRFPVALCLLALALGRRPSSSWLLWGMLTAALVVGWYGLYSEDFFNVTRVEGMGGNAVTFGNLSMLLAMMLILHAALSTDMRVRLRLALLVGAALALVATYESGTRSSIMALAVLGALLLFLRKDRFHRWLLTLGAAGVVFGSALVWNSPTLRDQLRLTEAQQDIALTGEQNYATSIGARLVMWRAAWNMFQDRPITGVGPRGYRKELQKRVESGELPPIQYMFGHAHSDGLHSLATAGSIGFLAYVGIIMGPLLFFSLALRRAGDGTHVRLYAAAGLLTVGAYVCFGLVNVNMDRPLPGLAYPLLVCALAAQLLTPWSAGLPARD